MKKNKKIGLVIMLALIAVVAYVGVRLNQPVYTLTMDVNPSIEIVSNRLERVVEVNPLNEDAREMLKDYKIKDRKLAKTIEDLADLMVLTGYISGGKDNLVMITVNDNEIDQNSVDKLNNALVAYLENKQIEATIVNQAIAKDYENSKTGKELVARKISERDNELDYDQLVNLTLIQLVEYAEARNISPEVLFSRMLETKGKNLNNDTNEIKKANKELIGEARAKEIALALVEGEIVEFELDDLYDDDDNPEYDIKIIANSYKYEIEIDAYTGKVLEFEKDDDYKDHVKATTSTKVSKDTDKRESSKSSKKQLIGEAKAKEIALALVNGKITDFELDDGEYEIEIVANGYEYEIEIDAYTGEVLEFEKDD